MPWRARSCSAEVRRAARAGPPTVPALYEMGVLAGDVRFLVWSVPLPAGGQLARAAGARCRRRSSRAGPVRGGHRGARPRAGPGHCDLKRAPLPQRGRRRARCASSTSAWCRAHSRGGAPRCPARALRQRQLGLHGHRQYMAPEQCAETRTSTRAHGCVCAGRAALRDAHRTAALLRPRGRAAGAPGLASSASVRLRAGASRAGGGRPAVSGQGARPAARMPLALAGACARPSAACAPSCRPGRHLGRRRRGSRGPRRCGARWPCSSPHLARQPRRRAEGAGLLRRTPGLHGWTAHRRRVRPEAWREPRAPRHAPRRFAERASPRTPWWTCPPSPCSAPPVRRAAWAPSSRAVTATPRRRRARGSCCHPPPAEAVPECPCMDVPDHPAWCVPRPPARRPRPDITVLQLGSGAGGTGAGLCWWTSADGDGRSRPTLVTVMGRGLGKKPPRRGARP